ncbi:MAG TPA: ATP synthase F1 subunit delta [Erysipelotrichaceae bacterium]|nr:ATP synthase F1 subunit delta [Erysipelotrichaceae bacterium]
MANEVAERYAQGLFELAWENSTAEAKKEQAECLLETIRQTPELNTLLRAVKITKDEKKSFIENSFKNVLDADMIRFIKLLIDKGRIYYLQDILHEYVNLSNQRLGIENAVIWSARPLKKDDLDRLHKALEKKSGKKVNIENKIDPDLIAGIKVTMGSQVTDVTMKNRIDSMKEVLLKGGRA